MLKDPTLSAYFRVLGFEIDDAARQHTIYHRYAMAWSGSVRWSDSVHCRYNMRALASVVFTAESTACGQRQAT